MKAAVVGAKGGMGGWLVRHLATLSHEVTAVDTRTDPLVQLHGFDLVVVSVPISTTPDVIRVVAPKMRRGTILAEVASLKEESHRALSIISNLGLTPLCLHPIFGPSTDSLSGRVVAVVPVVDAEEEAGLARSIFPGADVVTLSAARHDRCMAAVLSLPYAVNLALSRVLGGEDLKLASQMAGSTFAVQYTLAQSVAGESPTLTRDLLSCNASLVPLLRAFEDALGDVVWASCDDARFSSLHTEIIDVLSRDPSFAGANRRRQRAHMAVADA